MQPGFTIQSNLTELFFTATVSNIQPILVTCVGLGAINSTYLEGVAKNGEGV